MLLPNVTATSTSDSARLWSSSLQNLRSAWPDHWPGLPVVVRACQLQIWGEHLPSAGISAHMLKAADALAAHMESLSQSLSQEPHYHNRLHTADALVSLTVMLCVLKKQQEVVPDEWAAALLLAVTSHDVLHPGGANSYLQEFESQSVKELKHWLERYEINAHWSQCIEQLILNTDPSLVPVNHDKVIGTEFTFNLDWATVLVNEADILASASAEFGQDLGNHLAQEWQWKDHPLHTIVGTVGGRVNFLKSLRFSSPAALALNMPLIVAEQLQNLTAGI